MNQYAISTPEGTRDRLFAATRMFRQNEKRIRDLFEARGYDEIITPSLVHRTGKDVQADRPQRPSARAASG